MGITSPALFITHLLKRWKMIYCFEEVYLKTTSWRQRELKHPSQISKYRLERLILQFHRSPHPLLGLSAINVNHDFIHRQIINCGGPMVPFLLLIACTIWASVCVQLLQ